MPGSRHRGCGNTVIELRVAKLLVHVPRRIEDRSVHRRGRHQGRRDELRIVVGDPAIGYFTDEGRETDLHRQQIQQGFEESGYQNLVSDSWFPSNEEWRRGCG